MMSLFLTKSLGNGRGLDKNNVLRKGVGNLYVRSISFFLAIYLRTFHYFVVHSCVHSKKQVLKLVTYNMTKTMIQTCNDH